MNVKLETQQQNNVVISTPPQWGRNLCHVLTTRACHSMVKRSLVASRLLGMTFGVLVMLSFIIPPARAEQTDRFVVGSTCFRKDECTSPMYKGLLGSKDPFCNKYSPLHSEGAIQRGFNYNCYTKPVPYKLQVPFLVPGFFGTANSLELYLEQLYKFLIGVSGVLAGIMIIYAGVKWLTSAGNPERISDAKSKVAGACVGLVLVLSSYLLLNTINPDLVHLRLPPVKLIRHVGEIKETKCKNDLKFPCGGKRTEPGYSVHGQAPPQFFQPDDTKNGTYLCDKYPGDNPCGLAEASTCIGIACEPGECADIVEDRITPEAKELLARIQGYNSAISTTRACFNRSFCNGCEIPIIITNPGDTGSLDLVADRNLHLCASRACECVVSVRKDEDDHLWLQCIKRKEADADCSADAECAEDLRCVPGAVSGVIYTAISRGLPIPGELLNRPGAHGVCKPPQKDGLPCHDRNDCASGICGAVTITGLAYICAGGSNDSHCGSAGTGYQGSGCGEGLRCIDTWGGGGLCSDGSRGSVCRNHYQCRDQSRGCSVSPSADLPSNETWIRVGECL